jgi:P4 family phage/plasmid primase-like protien
MGVFGDWSERYIETGLSVIPLNGKRPFLTDWQTHCDTLAEPEVLAHWLKSYADSNIGLCLGKASGVVAVDVDSDDDKIVHIVNEILPASQAIKVGKKGFTAFYKWLDYPNKNMRDGSGNMVVEFLNSGRQTVLPPSIHPDTRRAYEWRGSVTLLDIGDDLQVVTASQLDLLFQSILAVGDKTNIRNGRNDALKAYVCALADKHTIDEVITRVITYDRRLFGDGCLFEDKSEFKNKDVYANALRFVTSILKSIHRLKAQRGEPAKKVEPITASKDTNFHKVTEQGKYIPEYESMGKYLANEMGLIHCNGSFYAYNGKCYEFIDDAEVKHKIYSLLGPLFTPVKVAGFFDAIKTVVFKKDISFGCIPGFMNLNNGVLDITQGRLLPHSREYYFNSTLSTLFDSTAQCPEWLKFLDFIFEGNGSLLLAVQEMFGYCIQGGKPWLHKVFMLYGDGRNGKSTLLEVLVALVGKENVSNVPLSGLSKPFSVIMAEGKLVNAVSEGESRDLSSEAFKAAASGDSLIAAHKGKPEFPMPWTARMVISLNTLPNFRDASTGNFERSYIIPFKRYITPEERDPGVADRLLLELPGILNWSLVGLQRLLERKRLLDLEAQHDALEEYKIATDSVYEWCMEFVKVDDALPETQFHPAAHYQHYKNFTETNGRYAVQRVVFCKNLLRFINNSVTGVTAVTGRTKTKRVYFARCAFVDNIMDY